MKHHHSTKPHNHDHIPGQPCHCADRAAMLEFAIHPNERGKVYLVDPGADAMNKLIAAMCNDGIMTIRTLDETGNELTRSLSKSEPEARKQVNKA